jgi:FkbM family methyltransferase
MRFAACAQVLNSKSISLMTDANLHGPGISSDFTIEVLGSLGTSIESGYAQRSRPPEIHYLSNLMNSLQIPEKTLGRRLAILYRRFKWKLQGASNEIVFVRGGFTWCGPTRCSITKAIFLTGGYQDKFIKPVLASLDFGVNSSGCHVVNIGANLGDIAIPLTKYDKTVVAIEPNPDTFDRLRRNVKNNNLDHRILCVNVAVGAQNGEGALAIARDPGNSELLPADGKTGFSGVDEQIGLVKVPIRRLDTILADLNIPLYDVVLVWSDTQGFETNVIRSGAELWQRGVPLWVELWPRGLACHGGVEAFLEACSEYFSHFKIGTSLGKGPLPIKELKAVATAIPDGDFVDILLQP